MAEHNLHAKKHYYLEKVLVHFLEKHGHLQHFKEQGVKYYHKIYNKKVSNKLKKFLPLRFIVELKYEDMEKTASQFPKMVINEPVMVERILDDFVFKIVDEAFNNINSTAQTQETLPIMDKSLIQLAIRITCFPDIYSIKNGNIFEKGIRVLKGVLTAHTVLKKYIRNSIWACPENCTYNYVSRGTPSKAPSCEDCLTAMTELAQCRDTGDLMKAEIVPIEAFEPNTSRNKIFKSWIVLITDELVKNIKIGHLYNVIGVFQFSKQQIKAWHIEEIVEQPLVLDSQISKEIKISKSQYLSTQQQTSQNIENCDVDQHEPVRGNFEELVNFENTDGLFEDSQITINNNQNVVNNRQNIVSTTRLLNESMDISSINNFEEPIYGNIENDVIFDSENGQNYSHQNLLPNDHNNGEISKKQTVQNSNIESTTKTKDNFTKKSGAGNFLFGNDDFDDLDELFSSNFTKDDIVFSPKSVNNPEDNIIKTMIVQNNETASNNIIQNNPNISIGSVNDYDKFRDDMLKQKNRAIVQAHSTLKDVFKEKLINIADRKSENKQTDLKIVNSPHFVKIKNDFKKSFENDISIRNDLFDLKLCQFDDEEFLKPNACFSNKFSSKHNLLFNSNSSCNVNNEFGKDLCFENTIIQEISRLDSADANKENSCGQNNRIKPQNQIERTDLNVRFVQNNDMNGNNKENLIMGANNSMKNQENPKTSLMSKYRYVKRQKSPEKEKNVKKLNQTKTVPQNNERIKTELQSQIVNNYALPELENIENNMDLENDIDDQRNLSQQNCIFKSQNEILKVSRKSFSSQISNNRFIDNNQIHEQEREFLNYCDISHSQERERLSDNLSPNISQSQIPNHNVGNNTQNSQCFPQTQRKPDFTYNSSQLNQSIDSIESIEDLHEHFKNTPYAFVQILASEFAGKSTPLNKYACLKFGLLLSLATISPTSNNQPFHVLAIGDDSLTAVKLINKFGSYAKRLVSSTDYVTGGSIKKGTWLEAGPMILARNGVCVLGDWCRYNKKQNAVTLALESGLIRLINTKPEEDIGVPVYPLESALWTYWAPQSKIKDKPLFSAVLNLFGLCLPCDTIENDENDEMTNHSLNLMMGIEETNFLDNLNISEEDFKNYLNKITRIQVSISKEAERLIQSYFVVTRRVRPDCVPLSALKCITRLAEAHCRLRQNNEVSKQDAVAAIWLCESGLCYLWGESIIPTPKSAPIERLQQMGKSMREFEKWLNYYIASTI